MTEQTTYELSRNRLVRLLNTNPEQGLFTLRYLAEWLYKADDKPELYKLILENRAWMDIKFEYLESDASFLDDVNLAIGDFSDPLSSLQELLTYVGLDAVRRIVRKRIENYSDIDLRTLVYLGQTSEAVNQSQLRTDPLQKSVGLITVYKALESQGFRNTTLLEKVEGYLAYVALNSNTLKTWKELLCAYARANDLSNAERLLAAITDEKLIEEIRSELATEFAAVGRFEKALALAQAITKKHLQVSALTSISTPLAKHGYQQQAVETLEEAIKAEKTPVDTKEPLLSLEGGDVMPPPVKIVWESRDNLEKIAVALAEIGNYAQATAVDHRPKTIVEIVRCILRSGSRIEVGDLLEEAYILAYQTPSFIRKNIEWVVADKGTSLSATVHNGKDDYTRRAVILRELAKTMVDAGLAERADAVFAEVLEMICTIPPHQSFVTGENYQRRQLPNSASEYGAGQLSELCDLALALAEKKRMRDARTVASLGWNIAMSAPIGAGLELESLGKLLVIHSQFEPLEAVLKLAEVVGREGQPQLLSKLSFWLAEAGRPAEARAVFNKMRDMMIAVEGREVIEEGRAEISRLPTGQMTLIRVAPVVIDHEVKQIKAICAVAFSISHTDRKAAEHLIDHITTISQKITNPYSTALVFISIVETLTKIGGGTTTIETLLSHVRKDIRTLTIPREKVTCLQALVKVLAQSDRFRDAEEAAMQIQVNDERAFAFRNIAKELAMRGSFDYAEELSFRSEVFKYERDAQGEAICFLAAALAQSGQQDRAFDLARKVPTAHWKAKALGELAVVFAKSPDSELSKTAIKEAQVVVEEIEAPKLGTVMPGYSDGSAKRVYPVAQTFAMRALALALARTGNGTEAQSVLEKTHAFTLALHGDGQKAEMSELVLAFAEIGAFDSALELCRSMREERERLRVIHILAMKLLDENQIVRGIELLETRSVDDYLRILAEAKVSVHQMQPILREAIRIISWTRPDWKEISVIMEDGV